jgi:Gpi18-like mannosyltransferase
MFGLAFAFKQQALFLAPLLLTLLIWRRVKLWHLLLVPATYLVMMVPAAIAGRPWGELLAIYVGQADVMHSLSLNAPNPWWFLRTVVDYRAGLLAGLLAGTVAAGVLAWRSTKLPQTSVSILLVATVCAAVIPWVLPKMTARYFFIADLLTIALAFARPRLWPAAVLIQLGSLLAVFGYFLEAWETTSSAFAPITLGVGLLLYELFANDSAQASNGHA